MGTVIRVKLDKKLWSKLPSELLERTLAFLPCSIFFRFRCVCKRWNSLPSCPSFLKLCKRLPLQTAPCILFQDDEKAGLNTDECKLFHSNPTRGACTNSCNIDLEFLKEQMDHAFKEDMSTHRIHTADGGLFLIASDYGDGRHERFSVCNPLLKCWRLLPILPTKSRATRCHIQRLVVDKLTKTYKVIVVTRKYNPFTSCAGSTYVYDSVYKCWNETGKLRNWNIMNQTIVCGNVMYAIVSYSSIVLMAYDIGIGVWNEISVQPPISCEDIWSLDPLQPHFLVESKGRALLVMTNDFDCPCDIAVSCDDIAVWELKIVAGSTAKWKELDAAIPDQLIKHKGDRVEEMDWAYLSSWGVMAFEDSLLLKRPKEPRIMVYDLLRGSWRLSRNTWPFGSQPANYQLHHFSVASLSLGMEV